ncbi:radical SAM protein, partial [candidate division KSB1 bacterium]|nr:radical SAM protein [candidate division KSB1 bacterium]
HANPLTYVPDNVNSFSNNYKNLFKIAVKYGDIKSMTAIHDWWRYPITAVMTVKGCTHNCIICGGAHKALKLYANRHKPAYRDPKLIVEDIRQLSRFTTSPIFIVGDLNQPGAEYADAVLSGLKKLNLKNQMVLEFFDAANRSYYEKVAAAFENFNFEISPESHDETIRRKCGKLYSNEDMENNIQYALESGCQKFDVFFMIGVAGQAADSVLETVDYCKYLLQKFGTRVVPFIAPLAPFLDPGSIAFENPERYGYKILFHTLEEHRQALTKPSWKYFLNYETKWLSRDQIVDITYEAGKRLNQIKLKYGQIDAQTFQKVDRKIELARTLVQRIDDIMKTSDDGEQKTKLAELKFDLRQDSVDTVCEENEIKWPMLKSGFRYFNIAKAILFE